MCLRGVSELNDAWLSRTDDPEVAVYLVWSSQLGAEERHVAEATTLLSDPRARHFWDPGRRVGRLFQPVLETDGAAWDVWMLFDRETVWEKGERPEIAWWEHQLQGMDPERRLDPRRFAEKAASLQADGPAGGRE